MSIDQDMQLEIMNQTNRAQEISRECKNSENNIKDAIKDAKEALESRIIAFIHETEKIAKTMKAEMRKMKEAREIERSEFDFIRARMDELENYIKNDRFHNILKAINKLEDEFHAKAVAIVQSKMGNG